MLRLPMASITVFLRLMKSPGHFFSSGIEDGYRTRETPTLSPLRDGQL